MYTKNRLFPVIIALLLTVVLLAGCPVDLPTPAKYTITFDNNDPSASGSMAPLSVRTGDSVSLTPCAFILTGSAFAGWSITEDGPVAYGDGAPYKMGDTDVTLYAQWVVNGYTITFLPNDSLATGTMPPQVITSGGTAALSLCGFSKTGYTFAGWSATAGGAVAYDDGDDYTMGAADVTLYATWTPNDYTITFDKNDPAATGTMGQQTIACDATAALTPNAFSKSGYHFAGWATTAGGIAEFDDGDNYTMGPANTFLYAKWTPNNYTITFDKNDLSATGTMSQQTIACNATAPLSPNAFSNSGYSFSGWAATSGGSVAYTDGADYTMGPADVTLYAKWTVSTNCTVTFDSQGGSAVPPQSVSNGSLAAEPTAPTWTAHALVGWYKEPTCVTRWNFAVDTVTADITLYAKWLTCTEGLEYTLINGDSEYSVGKGTANTNGIVVIPEYWAGKEVTALSDFAFQYCSGMTSVTIPQSVTMVGKYAFYLCSTITSIPIPANVISIGSYAFYGCSALTGLTLPNGISTIGNYTFYYCSSLTSLTIPDGVTSIGSSAFSNCSALTNLSVPNGVTVISDSTFYGCSNLTSLTLPNGITTIGPNAFQDCIMLTGLTLPNGVTTIGDAAFRGCTKLTSLALPNTINSIGVRAFTLCFALTSLTIPDGVTIIRDETFRGCTALTALTLPGGATAIGSYAFGTCTNLTSLTIPADVTTLGEYAFTGCSGLTSLSLPGGVTDLGRGAFYGCTGLTSLTIPSGVTVIKDQTFYGCTGLTSLTLPSVASAIGQEAFENCEKLTGLTLPSSLTTIGGYAFRNCFSLTTLAIPSTVTSIGPYAFYCCESLTSLTIPSGVTAIAESTFSGCQLLTSLTLPDGLTTIGNYAFSSCYYLPSLTIPGSVTSIGYSAFNSCNSLTSLTIPSGVTSIERETFYHCSSLSSIIIHSGITSIGDDAFRYCLTLTSVTVNPNSPPAIGATIFRDCPLLTASDAVKVPAGTLSVYEAAPGWSDYADIIAE